MVTCLNVNGFILMKFSEVLLIFLSKNCRQLKRVKSGMTWQKWIFSITAISAPVVFFTIKLVKNLKRSTSPLPTFLLGNAKLGEEYLVGNVSVSVILLPLLRLSGDNTVFWNENILIRNSKNQMHKLSPFSILYFNCHLFFSGGSNSEPKQPMHKRISHCRCPSQLRKYKSHRNFCP